MPEDDVSLSTPAWTAHVAEAIRGSPVVERPFCHLIVDDAFPVALYRRMLDELPSDGAYEAFAFGRRRLHVPGRVGFWGDLYARLLATCLGPELVRRLRSHLRPGVDAAELAIRECTLVRDTFGYGIGPHSDDPRLKALSVICYLPRTRALRRCGTSIVVPRPGVDVAAEPYRWHAWRKFEIAADVAFLPNRLLAFPVTRTSYHAVKRVWRLGRRDSLQLFMI